MAPCDSVAAGVSCIVCLFLLHRQQIVKKISALHAVVVCSFSPVSLFLQRERLPAKRKRKRVQCTPVLGKKAMQCAAARSLLFAFSEFGPTLWLHFNAVRFQLPKGLSKEKKQNVVVHLKFILLFMRNSERKRVLPSAFEVHFVVRKMDGNFA